MAEAIAHPLLAACGVRHGFGVVDAPVPAGLIHPRQVHGSAVARVDDAGGHAPAEADAIVSALPDRPVGVLTADCVPVLAASRTGVAVAAIHAGWRGLAEGVVERGVRALAACAPAREALVAVVGPHVGACCYEIDAPVVSALRERFGAATDGALSPSRPGHHRLSLARLVVGELRAAGVEDASIAVLADACTACDPRRFHSYRRDGERAGRLVHHIAARGQPRAAS